MSEFTLDIQLTELGFSSWNFPLCEPPSVKEPFLPAQSTSEKPAPETETSTDYSEDAHISPSDLANKSFLQDHQYFSPFKHMPARNAETAQSNSKNIPVEKKDKAICNSWNKARRRDTTEQRDNDEEQDEQDEQEEKKNDEICSEVSQDVPSITPDDSMSEEEKIHEEVELILSDDEEYDYDGVEEEEEEEEEEDYIEDEKEEDEEDNSSSEMTGCRDNEENRCHVCDLTFSSLFLLREHLNMHTGVRPYRCDECGKQFCQLVNYRAHLRSHSQKAATAIHCRVCSATFENEELLKEHLDTNHFEKEFYQCDFCKQIFTDLDVCKVHVEAHRQQAKRHLCLKCGSSFRLRNSLLRHLEWHSRGIFCCTDCDRTFPTKSSLLRHSFSHLGVLPYTCLKCKRHFRLASLYRSHECKPESIQCMACLVFFDSQEDFDKHKKDTGCWGHQGTLPTKTDEIRCMECGLVFASVEELKKHGSTHQRVLKCAECGMGFRSSLMLMSHMGGHAGQRPCLCQDCGLGFPHQQGYDSHLKTCGMVTPPVPAVKKPKPKATPSTQIMKPVAPTIIFQTIGQATNPATFSNSLREVHMIPLGNQNKPADGRWKFALNKESPSGMPVVMLLPVSGTQYTSTLEPQRKSAQTLPPPPLVLKTSSSAPHVVSLPVAPSGSIISKEAQSAEPNIPLNTLIPVESHDSTPKTRWAVLEDHGGVQVFGTETLKAGEQTSGVAETNQGVNGIAQVAENEEKSQSNMKTDALVDEKANSETSSDTVPLNSTPPVTPLCLIKEKDDDNIKNGSSNLKDLDSSPVMAEDEISVSLKPNCPDSSERQMPDSSETDSGNPVSGSSEITCHNKSGKEQRCFHEVESSDRMCAESPMENGPRGQNESGFDVEVEISEDVDLSSMEVEIGDEDSGVDMLEGELHECVTCGQVLPEKEMVQHHIKHASVSDKPELSSVNCASKPTAASPPASPLRKRLRSGTVL